MFRPELAERRLKEHLKKCPVKGCEAMIHVSINDIKQHLRIKHKDLSDIEIERLAQKFMRKPR